MTDEPGSELDQAANLLGALSLLITDQMTDAMAEAGGRPESGAAALSALLHFLDQPTVDLLRQVLGLTSSGTVRLIDRMAESGYVQRGPGADGRSTSVSLTPARARFAGSAGCAIPACAAARRAAARPGTRSASVTAFTAVAASRQPSYPPASEPALDSTTPGLHAGRQDQARGAHASLPGFALPD